MKLDGSSVVSTSQGIEELIVLSLEIKTVAVEVVMCYDVWTAELQSY